MSIEDPLGRVTTYVYDARDQLLELHDAAGNQTTLWYNAPGDVELYLDARDVLSTYTYRSFAATEGRYALGFTVPGV